MPLAQRKGLPEGTRRIPVVSMETLSQFPLHKAVHKALPALAKAIGNNDG